MLRFSSRGPSGRTGLDSPSCSMHRVAHTAYTPTVVSAVLPNEPPSGGGVVEGERCTPVVLLARMVSDLESRLSTPNASASKVKCPHLGRCIR